MTNPLATAMKEDSNLTLTQNCAATHKSSTSKVLDFFAQGAAMRKRKESDLVLMFEKAFLEDSSLALKALFYIRDIRKGQGERQTFRHLMNFLGNTYPERVVDLIPFIPFFGRWDDLESLIGTKSEKAALTYIKMCLDEDIKSEKPSLLAKWLPSENTSSKETRGKATHIRKFLELSSQEYRKILSSLRTRLGIVEKDMASKNWEGINYEHVPSKAMLVYRKAFRKRDEARFTKYLERVKSGTAKIKAGTLYPHEIVQKASYDRDGVLDAQWKALPNYIKTNESALVLADVSGSMGGTPMLVSVAMALYISERVTGPFKDVFMTFHSEPEILHIEGKTIYERQLSIKGTKFGLNTNLQKAFDRILHLALESKCSSDDLPKTLFIITDMEFDAADSEMINAYNKHKPNIGKKHNTNFKAIAEKFASHGYVMPQIVFWNVDAKTTQSPVTKDEKGVYLVSGFSPTILEHALNKTELSETPLDLMMRVLLSDRYKDIA